MGFARLLMLTAAVVVLGACASRPAPVPVLGVRDNFGPLVGEWRGEYTSPETGRQGTIYFLLRPDEEVSRGDVVMIPTRGARVVNWENQVTMVSARHLAEVLSVRFVRLESGMVSGRLEPYRDPDCGNVHVTTFFGEVKDGRTIEGSFISRSEAHGPYTGEWSARLVQ